MAEEQKKKKLGEILYEDGLVTKEQIDQALEEQKETGQLLGRILVENGFLTEPSLLCALAKQTKVPYIPLSKYLINPDAKDWMTKKDCVKHHAVIFDGDDETFSIAVTNPLNDFLIKDLEEALNKRAFVYVAKMEEIESTIDSLYLELGGEGNAADAEPSEGEEAEENVSEDEASLDEAIETQLLSNDDDEDDAGEDDGVNEAKQDNQVESKDDDLAVDTKNPTAEGDDSAKKDVA